MVIVNRLTATQRELPKMAVHTTLPDRQTSTPSVRATKHTSAHFRLSPPEFAVHRISMDSLLCELLWVAVNNDWR